MLCVLLTRAAGSLQCVVLSGPAVSSQQLPSESFRSLRPAEVVLSGPAVSSQQLPSESFRPLRPAEVVLFHLAFL